jgi:hypothetical protein
VASAHDTPIRSEGIQRKLREQFRQYPDDRRIKIDRCQQLQSAASLKLLMLYLLAMPSSRDRRVMGLSLNASTLAGNARSLQFCDKVGVYHFFTVAHSKGQLCFPQAWSIGRRHFPCRQQATTNAVTV